MAFHRPGKALFLLVVLLFTMLASTGTWDWLVFSTSVDRQKETWPSGAPEPSGWFAQRGRDLGERI